METFINKQSLADKVAAKIQEQVLLGKYQVNDKLPIEPELMKSFGVGRSTIREAIKILTNSGLLRVQQGAGTFVAKTTATTEPFDQRIKRTDIKDLNEIRELFEMKIAEKAALNRTAKDIETIRQHLANRKLYAELGELEACIDADIKFHVAIAEASKNEILADLFKSISWHLKKTFEQLHKDCQDFLQTQSMHQQLLDSITAQDAKKAWQNVAAIIGHVSKF